MNKICWCGKNLKWCYFNRVCEDCKRYFKNKNEHTSITEGYEKEFMEYMEENCGRLKDE